MLFGLQMLLCSRLPGMYHRCGNAGWIIGSIEGSWHTTHFNNNPTINKNRQIRMLCKDYIMHSANGVWREELLELDISAHCRYSQCIPNVVDFYHFTWTVKLNIAFYLQWLPQVSSQSVLFGCGRLRESGIHKGLGWGVGDGGWGAGYISYTLIQVEAASLGLVSLYVMLLLLPHRHPTSQIILPVGIFTRFRLRWPEMIV